MKIGDLVKYRGWSSQIIRSEPLGIVVDQAAPDSDFHHRIRVMWLGDEVPIQSNVLSIKGSRITTWVNPKHFEVINGK